MKKRKALLFFIVAMMIVASIPLKQVWGASETVYVIDTEDDAFITQTGNYFGETPNLPLRSGTTDIISGLRFQNVSIPQDAKINNATLFVRTLFTFDPGVVLATIYGVAENNAYAFNSSSDFTRPYTIAFTIWNVSDVMGNSWHNVSVTTIVQEIISRYGWRANYSLAFLILGDSGTPRRQFSTIDQNIVYRPRLEITYDVTPPDPSSQADPPYNDTDEWTWTLNETYRGFDIWDVVYTDIERTGTGADVNWNTVNITELSESDSGAAIVRNNDTWATATSFRKSYTGSIYNDTGSLNVNSYFLRWRVSVTGVNTNEIGNDIAPLVFGLSTSSPAGGNGMAYGAGGEWVGLIMVVNPDDTRWRIQIKERDGLLDWTGNPTFWFTEDEPTMLYFEAFINMTGVPYITYSMYNDPEFTDLNFTSLHVFTIATGPFRYPQILAGMGQASTGTSWYDTYTYLDFELPGFEPVVFISYPNGTLVDPDPIDEDPEDYIDDISGGADPEDPETEKYGDALTKNRWKMFVLVVGMVMFLGTPAMGIMNRASFGRWYLILFVSLCGLSLLWSLRYM